jgi:hypothetical protein
LDFQPSAQHTHKLVDQREAHPDSFRLAREAAVDLTEGVPEEFELVGRDAPPCVRNGELDG